MRLQFGSNFAISDVMEVHYYDGNCGPLYHGADKIEIEPSSMSDAREDRKLIELADQRGLKLAVNQNGHWAPYFSYLRQVLRHGLLGEIVSCDIHIA